MACVRLVTFSLSYIWWLYHLTVLRAKISFSAISRSVRPSSSSCRISCSRSLSVSGVSIPIGALSKNFSVSVKGDTTPEADETFNVTLSNVTGATLVDAQAVGTIRNDDGSSSTPALSIGNLSLPEGNSGTKLATFTVQLSMPAPADVTYNIATTNGTAIAGIDLSNQSDAVASFLIELRQRQTMNESALFSETLIQEVGTSSKLLRNTHRFAGFAVLKSPDVPSVLMELGYLSNRHDEKVLRDPRQHDKLARSILRATDAFFERKERLSRS